MRTRRPRVKRSKGRMPQARKPPRRPRPSKPRRKPEKPRGSETGSSARTRAGCWATSEIASQDARDTSPTLPWPEPGTSEGFRPLHAFAIAELRRTPLRRSSTSENSTYEYFIDRTYANRVSRKFVVNRYEGLPFCPSSCGFLYL